jgi:hypothetical protein
MRTSVGPVQHSADPELTLSLEFPDAVPFTSMLSLDVEEELGIEFDRARLHGMFLVPGSEWPVKMGEANVAVIHGMSKE